MPKVGGRRKKARSNKKVDEESLKAIPRIFVVQKGRCSNELHDTTIDMRKCFYPNTSMKLEDTKKMALKSYIKAAKYYSVTSLVVLQQSNEKNYLRIIKIGAGEMLFRVLNYCRMRDVLHAGGQPFSFSFKNALLVLSNFTESSQLKMIAHGLQELFPPLDLKTIKMEHIKRVVSFTYITGKKCIYMRHYKIVMQEGGVDNTLLKIEPVDLSQFKTIGEYFLAQGNKHHIHGEVGQHTVKLVEMGPRLKIKFISYKEKLDIQNQDEKQPQEQQNYKE